jgi:hypothetical protein
MDQDGLVAEPCPGLFTGGPMKRVFPLLLISVPLAAACSADLLGDRDDDPSSVGPDGSRPGPATPDQVAGERADITPARLLTDIQYNNAVAALFGVGSAPLSAQIAAHGDVYDNDASGLTSSPRLVEAFEAAAAHVASEAFESGAVRFDCASGEETTCIGEFISQNGLRIFRRPPSEDEVGILTRLFASLRAEPIEDTPEAAAEGVLTAMLQMPAFLFRTELGEGRGGRTRLTGFEVASRLSFALTNSTPDDELLQAAAEGLLDEPAGGRAAAERLLASPQARQGLLHFVDQWLGIQDAPRLNRDPELFPQASTELGAAMYTETRLFFEDLFWNRDGDVNDLFAADYSFVNADLAELYGLSGEFGSEFVETRLPDERRGVLTQGSYLTSHSVFDRSHPIARGVYTLRKIMCFDLGSPPNDVGALPEDRSEAQSVREMLKQHAAGACAGCHKMIDPVGLSFEAYDALGVHRSVYDDGSPVEATAEVLIDDVWVPVDGGADLSLALAESNTAGSCFTQQAMAYMLGRTLKRQDLGTVERIASETQNLREIVLNIVSSEPFLYRDVPAQETCE